MQILFLDLLVNIVNEQWHKSLDLISRSILIPHNTANPELVMFYNGENN